MQTALIVGLGNALCGDDAAGLLAARELHQRWAGRYVVCEHEGDNLVLMELWAEYRLAVLIDAANSGHRPGSIYRFDAADGKLPYASRRDSTHSFGVGDAIELARTLGRLPASLIVYAIEIKHATPGGPVSRAVRRAIPELVRRISEELLVQAVAG